jgi:MarR family transcriptional repressor of emrRAB
VFRAIGLTENSFHVLCLLMAADGGRAAPSELAELVGISRANMTRILESLESDGFVTRAIEARDARRHAIQITAAGREVTSSAVPRMSEPLQRAFSGLSAEEFVQLDNLLRKAIKSFDQPAVALRASA